MASEPSRGGPAIPEAAPDRPATVDSLGLNILLTRLRTRLVVSTRTIDLPLLWMSISRRQNKRRYRSSFLKTIAIFCGVGSRPISATNEGAPNRLGKRYPSSVVPTHLAAFSEKMGFRLAAYRSVKATSNELKTGLNIYRIIDFDPVWICACRTIPGAIG